MNESLDLTDDPHDPCAYDVQWELVNEDDPMGDSVPWVAPGVRATRLFRYIHPRCDNDVAQYIADSHE